MATKKDFRLFLLDGMALIYRAHFALIRSPIYTSGGFNSSAIFGAPPGLRAEAHSLAPMPRDMHGNDRPVQLVSNDGKSVMEVW